MLFSAPRSKADSSSLQTLKVSPLPRYLLLVFYLSSMALFCQTGRAQNLQLLPEIDGHLTINEHIRGTFQAKDTREGGSPTQAQVGPSGQFYLKPLLSLRKINRFDSDQSKARALAFSVGYLYLSSPTSPSTSRVPISVLSHLPVKTGLLLSLRNRADLDWGSEAFNWRYRLMPTVERTISFHGYHFIPYTSAEFYYESQYRKFSTTELYGGFQFPLGKRYQLTGYYEHQNNTGKKKNEQTHGLGLRLDIFLKLHRD